jgi:mRNA interferase YafQ
MINRPTPVTAILSGDWAGCRECHVRPDLLLIYRKPDADTLRLARLGSHSELFG